MFGYSEDELLQITNWKELTAPEFWEVTDQTAENLAKLGETAPYEKEMIRKDGSRWWGLFAPTRLSGSGIKSECMEFIIDITVRKQSGEELRRRTEELAAANRDLESFSYSVSHDLRTPLTTIMGFSDIIINRYGDILDESGKIMLGHLAKTADKMSSIISDLLNLARISKETLNCREINLSPVAKSILNDFRETDRERNVMISIPDFIPAFADAGLMTITLTNLISNAWKYTGKNPDARIDIGVLNGDNGNVYFIRDNGAGFDMNHAHKLFEPFQRMHSESQFSGTGVGLAIVQKIIQRHGGKIWAESETGRGSTFYFTLQCRRP